MSSDEIVCDFERRSNHVVYDIKMCDNDNDNDNDNENSLF